MRAIPVFIEEEHDGVLKHWYRHANHFQHKQHQLQKHSNILIHVDTHPDFKANPDSHAVYPSKVPKETPPEYGIASFILPAVKAKLFNRVMFARAPWAHQFKEDGETLFRYGKKKSIGPSEEGQSYGIDIDSAYYWSDGEYRPRNLLVDTVQAQLIVTTMEEAAGRVCEAKRVPRADGSVPWAALDTVDSERGKDRAQQGSCKWNAPVVLDIDIDTFSVHNNAMPRLRALLPEQDLIFLRDIFDPSDFEHGKTLEDRNSNRALLRSIHTGDAWSLVAGMLKWRSGWQLAHTLRILSALPPWAMGDILSLSIPEHISTLAQVSRLLSQLERLMKDTSLKPALITIARSVGTGFSPRPTAPLIECRLLAVLEAHLAPYGGISVTLPGGGAPADRREYCRAREDPDDPDSSKLYRSVGSRSSLPRSTIGWGICSCIYMIMVQFPIWLIGHMGVRCVEKGGGGHKEGGNGKRRRRGWWGVALRVSKIAACTGAALWAVVGTALAWVWLARPNIR